MKKLSTLLIIAFAMVLGLTQCKKKVDTIATPSDLGEAVHITVNVDDGGKHIVYPGTGAYVFENGDKLYVGNGGKYIGYLTYGSGAFSGDIYGPSTVDYLHFYFVGGLTPSTAPVINSTENFTVNIANQSSKLPVLSYGCSTEKYTTSTATYDCTLLNKCGLVEFGLYYDTPNLVKVGGMKTTATIDFANPGITPIDDTGNITLYYYPENNTRWAILMPQADVEGAQVTIGGDYYTVDVPAITANGYLHDVTAVAIDNYEPAFAPVFSVSSTKTVHFSPGNLQYKEGEGWRFAEHQYDCVGAWNTSSWVDLFGWGTGDDPLKTSEDPDDYATFNDWGDYCGDPTGDSYTWYTPSTEEWQYLFNDRTNAGDLYGFATVAGVHGIVVLPDNWTLPSGSSFSSFSSFYPGMSYWDDNIYDDSAWATMEGAGAVFLPAAGLRIGSDVIYFGEDGRYWSSTDYNGNFLVFNVDGNYPDYINYLEEYRYYGQSVRLVR